MSKIPPLHIHGRECYSISSDYNVTEKARCAVIGVTLLQPNYHETQRWMQCGIHALNNLLQYPVYNTSSFKSLCRQLAPKALVNPHCSMLGIGNYDVDVLRCALDQRGYTAHWHDARRPASSILFSQLRGVLVNVSTSHMMGLYKGRHWFALRPFNQGRDYWDLNSKMEMPKQVDDVAAYCEAILKADLSTQLLLITDKALEDREMLYHQMATLS